MEASVYILKDKIGKLSIGSTNDLARRLAQHKSGHTYTTNRMIDVELVFSQKFDNLQKARKVELRLKNLKRRDYLEKIIKDGCIKLKLG